ncbi:hypothetical protein I203_101173 [Kwoniella mangroviensis CBS 8507]|uniref:uncharacterized protein n=1 Tax=Kwoniella mangroviensis CBS 8507 TaxID=1296122 RepID=UPI00080CF586|nr:uncharacterized protein I203_02807 [Kwoniella mangroviensis CBS 8507]OCF68146.1 hypothetical protein I203_02807 [Kwoniella mangroviensis CBS 8507]
MSAIIPLTTSSTPSSHTSPAPKTPQPLQPIPLTASSRDGEDIQMISREITPSSPSASASASASASSPRSALGSGTGSGSGSMTLVENSQNNPDEVIMGGNGYDNNGNGKGIGGDVDRFLKKMEMEKKMQALQQRLELASIKATHGWKDMSIKEIETKLPPPTTQRNRQPSLLPASPIVGSPSRTSTIPYEPPSPSRPWQLIDVLWQPLPPPSHGRYPPSPSSPKKRSRTDDHDAYTNSRLNGLGLPPSPHRQKHPNGSVHRRASSSIGSSSTSVGHKNGFTSPSSPLRYKFDENPKSTGIPKKKRSYSHSNSNYINRKVVATTTSQDVDAAKALTHMLSSGGLSDDGLGDTSTGSSSKLAAPFLLSSHSLPIPEAFKRDRSSSPTIPSASPSKLPTPKGGIGRTTSISINTKTPNSHTRHKIPDSGSSTGTTTAPGTGGRTREEDKNAAELMMFLAHSPSPMKTVHSQEDDRPSLGMAARVLFADEEEPSNDKEASKGGASGARSSNLVLADPILPEK